MFGTHDELQSSERAFLVFPFHLGDKNNYFSPKIIAYRKWMKFGKHPIYGQPHCTIK